MQVDGSMGSAVIPFEDSLYLITEQFINELDPVSHELKGRHSVTKHCTYIWLKDFAHIDGNTITFLNDDGYVLQFEIPKRESSETVDLKLLTQLRG